MPPAPGPILHLPDALARSENGHVVSYCRVSEASQVTRGSLQRQKDAVSRAIRQAPQARLKRVVSGVERGKLSNARPLLEEAIEEAVRYGAILLANDSTRLLRAEDFDRLTNRLAEPTPDELAWLVSKSKGVVLATVLDPSLTLAELHSLAVRRGMNSPQSRGGRKSILSVKIYEGIAMELAEGETSYREIATLYGVSKSTVERIAREAEQAMFPQKKQA